MRGIALIAGCVLLGQLACSAPRERVDLELLQHQVMETERAFAATMAQRNHAAFVTFLSAETVFFSGPKPLRGAATVAEYWRKYYQGQAAPFSWAPQEVQVLDSGTLALSTGPVYDPSGKLSGTFTSIWRQEAPGTWRIIFDKGCPVCD